ncbi:hypothetical protein OHQ45_000149 [Citrobacter freundii]|nr:hypothetical protein [Citrobacter freundii]EKU0868570.1 hypothetical protein [Citrobacter freundii]EKU8447393.1 hypothetical protein [Citrobacter freundii]EKU8456471.1 hypothetical protein [Citrobacter freundii]EKV0934805.1 hypothetical protein [Citrobacter freundii]
MISREKFEQAIKARFGDLIDYRVCKNSDGEYMAWDTQIAWWAWQAAETDMAVQLANAESKRRELSAVVAENVALKNPDNWLSQSDYGYEASEVATQNGATEDESLRAGMVAIINRIETPATDAFLAEVRAQGLERLAKAWYAIANETASGISISESSRLKYRQRADDVADFANKIRQEAAQ